MPDFQTAQVLQSLNLGQYLILVEAVRQAGGVVSIDMEKLLADLDAPPPQMEVSGKDGPLVLRLV